MRIAHPGRAIGHATGRDGRPHLTEQAARNQWVRQIVARLAPVDDTVLQPLEGDTQVSDGLRRRHYTFGSSRREGIRAVVVSPATDDPGPWPAVLICPGRNARPEAVTGVDPPDYPDRDVAVKLARAGHFTLTLDYGLSQHELGTPDDGRDPASVLDAALRLRGDSVLAVLVGRTLAALTWLSRHPDVAPGRVGLFGHSLGGSVALHTALLYRGPLAVCTASHLGTYPVMFEQLASWDQYAALPSILRYTDLPGLYSALAPASLSIQYGETDTHLDPDDAASAGKQIQESYAAAGFPDHVEVVRLAMGHGTGTEAATRFFRRSLAVPVDANPPVPAARVHFDVSARDEISDLIDEALVSGALTLGPLGRWLEQLATQHIGRGTVAVSSGTAALEIALRIIGVEGRTVVIPVNTFFATAASAIRAGAKIAMVDMERSGLGMDPESLRTALADHDDVAAVIVVHIAGVVPPSLLDILAECQARAIAVVEDAAHALGSTFLGRRAGTFGQLAAFSLYPTKIVTSGEGGLVTGSDKHLGLARSLRDHGKRSFEENVHAMLGSNWRMSELHAAVGVTHLARLPELLAERRRLARWYDEHLTAVPDLIPYRPPDDVSSNYYKYVAILPDGVDRARLRQRLRAQGVALAGGVYDTPLHAQPYFAGHVAARGTFPNADWFAARHVCLPVLPGMTTDDQQRVLQALRRELS